jgi:ANTAR domain
VQAVEAAISSIAPSDEPAVVLSSLARFSNHAFSDACAIELSEGMKAPFRVCFPDEAGLLAGTASGQASVRTPQLDMKSIITTFAAGSGHGYASFAGFVAHSWGGRDPTADAIIARLLVDLALAVVQQERLAQAAARADSRAHKLAIDVIGCRIEGEATGILMARHQVTREEAVGILRQASGSSGRDLPEIAVGVVCAGDLAARHAGAARRLAFAQRRPASE